MKLFSLTCNIQCNGKKRFDFKRGGVAKGEEMKKVTEWSFSTFEKCITSIVVSSKLIIKV